MRASAICVMGAMLLATGSAAAAMPAAGSIELSGSTTLDFGKSKTSRDDGTWEEESGYDLSGAALYYVSNRFAVGLSGFASATATRTHDGVGDRDVTTTAFLPTAQYLFPIDDVSAFLVTGGIGPVSAEHKMATTTTNRDGSMYFAAAGYRRYLGQIAVDVGVVSSKISLSGSGAGFDTTSTSGMVGLAVIIP